MRDTRNLREGLDVQSINDGRQVDCQDSCDVRGVAASTRFFLGSLIGGLLDDHYSLANRAGGFGLGSAVADVCASGCVCTGNVHANGVSAVRGNICDLGYACVPVIRLVSVNALIQPNEVDFCNRRVVTFCANIVWVPSFTDAVSECHKGSHVDAV